MYMPGTCAMYIPCMFTIYIQGMCTMYILSTCTMNILGTYFIIYKVQYICAAMLLHTLPNIFIWINSEAPLSTLSADVVKINAPDSAVFFHKGVTY